MAQQKAYHTQVPIIDEILLGADPEIFLSKQGVFVPAEVTGIKGTKKSPVALPSGGAVQIDGLALEFNIQPAKTADDFVKNISSTLDDIRKVVDAGLEFNFTPAVTFTKEEFDKVSEENRKLGCDPDFDAYTMQEKTPPAGSEDKPFRTGAGHIHIGFTKDADPSDPRHVYDCSIIVQALDYNIARYERAWSAPNDRARLYGQMGSFRPKSYGLEYRVLGNDWLGKPNVQRLIFGLVRKTINDLLVGNMSYPLQKINPYGGGGATYYFLSNYCYADVYLKRLIKAAYDAGELLNVNSDARYYADHYYNASRLA